MAKKTSKSTSKKSKTPARKSKAAKRTPLIANLLRWGFVAGIWCAIILAGVFAYYAQELPSITKSASFDRKLAIIVKAADGSVAARYGEIVGNSVEIDDLPACLPQAVLSIEDRRFYHHFGLDPLGLIRAVV